MSYNLQILIPKDDITLTKREAFRQMAIDKGVARAIQMGIAPAEDQLDVRPFLPLLDAVAVIDRWLSNPLIAPVGGDISIFNGAAVVVMPATRLVVWYKVGIETTPVPVSELVFRTNAIAGSIMRQFDLEQIINADTMEGYFSNPIIWEPSRTYAAQVRVRIATGIGGAVQLGGFVIEPKGNTIVI